MNFIFINIFIYICVVQYNFIHRKISMKSLNRHMPFVYIVWCMYVNLNARITEITDFNPFLIGSWVE